MNTWGKYAALVEPQHLAAAATSDASSPAVDVTEYGEVVIFVNLGLIAGGGSSFIFDPTSCAAADADPVNDAVETDDFIPGLVPNTWTAATDNALYWRAFQFRDSRTARYLKPYYLEQTGGGDVCVTALLFSGKNQNPPIGAAGATAPSYTPLSFEV